MITQISWRNVWRSPVRSGVVIAAITLGLSLGIFMMAFSWGLTQQRASNVINTQTSHLQLHHPDYVEEPKMKFLLPEGTALLEELNDREGVKYSTPRLEAGGMLSTTKGAYGVQINGIFPLSEAEVTQLDTRIHAGSYFSEGKRNAILVGQSLAEKIGVAKKVGDSTIYNFRKKVVLTFQDKEGKSTQARFRVVGISQSGNSKFDEGNVYVRLADLQKLAKVDDGIHEIAVVLDDIEQAEVTAAAFSTNEIKSETWADLAPDLRLISESFEVSMYIFIGIILLALAFGIVNTMLMAVLERTRELGMLMAVGMNRGRVFLMIMLETIFLVAVGGPLGLLVGYLLVSTLGSIGIDMGSFSEAMSQFGIGSIVRPNLAGEYYFQIAIMVAITAILSAIYPALRALKLKPVEAIRSV